jgi:hypothetical protein
MAPNHSDEFKVASDFERMTSVDGSRLRSALVVFGYPLVRVYFQGGGACRDVAVTSWRQETIPVIWVVVLNKHQ